MDKYFIDRDITKASTLPASFYKSEKAFEELKNNLFSRSWQLVEVNEEVEHAQESFPFVSLKPSFEIENVLKVLNDSVGILPISQFRYASEYTCEYLVNAHWTLYCDNYLEGFHIPFVHPDLNKALDYKSYNTTLFDY